MFGRRKVATLVAEFLGTGVLTLLILSVQRSTIGVPFFVAAAAGLTLAMLTFALGGTSGAHFNPAVTIGMWTARRINTLNTVLYVVVQMLGAWGAYYLYTYFVNNSLQKVGGNFSGRVLVAEAVGAGLLSFGIAAANRQRFNNAAASAYAGVSYMVGIIAASSAAIGLLNPAVAFGVRAWVWGTYVLGPILGAIIGINLYNLLFAASEDLVADEAVAVKAPAARASAASAESMTTTTAGKKLRAARTTKKTTTRATTAKRKTTARSTRKK